MQSTNIDRHTFSTPCTPKANPCNKYSVRLFSERVGSKVKKLFFKPEYTSTPSYTLPKTSTPVLNCSNTPFSGISIMISTKKTRVNSTFKEDAKFKKLIAKKLFDEKQKILIKLPGKLAQRQVKTRMSTNTHQLRPLGHRIKKISSQQQQRSFIVKSARLVEELYTKNHPRSCTRCHQQQVDLSDANYLVKQLLYNPNVDLLDRLKKRSSKCRRKENECFMFAESNENLIKLENINFNFYSRN